MPKKRWTQTARPHAVRTRTPKTQRNVPAKIGATPPRADGWSNVLTGMGYSGYDRKQSTQFRRDRSYLQKRELLDIYAEDGIGKRIIDVVVDDMVREWYFVSGDPEGNVNKYMKTFNGKRMITMALRWGSLHGGAIGVLGINDGGTYEQPVNEGTIRSIEHVHVFDRWRVEVQRGDTYTDPEEKKFGAPKFYTVHPLQGFQFRVHETRVLRFDGPDTPDHLQQQNNNWNLSDLQHVYDRLRGLGESINGVEHILSEFIIGVLTIQNLQELIASGQESLVTRRLNLIDMTKHVLNSVILDNKETFARQGASVSGLSDLFEKLVQVLSASTSIPVTILMGESPAGLNATGQSDLRRYYDMVAARQEDRMLHNLETISRYIMLAKDSPFKGKELKEWSVVFPPLWTPTNKETAETRKLVAEADRIYVEMNAVAPEEVAISRFGGGEYSAEMKLAEGRDRSITGED